MTITMFVEILDNFQHLTWPISKSPKIVRHFQLFLQYQFYGKQATNYDI